VLQISGLTWAATIGVIVALLALDLALAALRPHRVGFKEATAWSVFYIAVALAFGAWMWMAHGSEFGTEYLAGYIVEKSLSVDNLFVFVIIMTTFAVPEEHQHKALTFGILLALIMRAIFIALGATLLSLFSFMFVIFGLLLHTSKGVPNFIGYLTVGVFVIIWRIVVRGDKRHPSPPQSR